ncbi:MAG: PAS domain S-box protein [Planctomycetaceae bacterium]|nr:PAS domain S-box protein [Planctomycetaceae bacterium]
MSTARNPLLNSIDILLAATCFVAAAVGTGVCAVDEVMLGTGHTSLVWISAASLVISGVAMVTLVKRQRRETHLAQLYLDRLVSGSLDALPQLDAGSSWQPVLARVHSTLESVHERVSDAEHGRAALDVRHKRCVTENERLNRILSAVAEPLIAVDPYDQLLFINRAAERLLGIDASSPEKRVMAQLGRCEKLASLIKDTQRRKLSTVRSEELEIDEPDGGRRWYNAAVTSLLSSGGSEKSGEPDGVVAVLRDMSAMKLVQKHNAEFVSNASHEMKAPLAGIRAYVELLADGDAEDEATREEFLHVINSQTDRLQRLVENLLNLARIEAGVVEVHKHAQGLNEVLAEAFNVTQPSAQNKGIEITQQLSELYLGVRIDRDLLLQCAINLLSNAVKYTPPGGRVTLRSRLAGDTVQFEVEDTGVGLSAEDCEKVFEKFYRVDKDKNMAAGTGLGLPLAKYIVEDVHGGQLSVKSQPNAGSTFTVTLPVAAR